MPFDMQQGFLRNSISSYASFGVNLLLRLFLYRTVLAQLGPELFGVWGILKGVVLLPAFFQQAVNNAVFLRTVRNPQESERLGAAMGVTTIFSSLIVLPAVIFAPELARFFRIPEMHLQTSIQAFRIVGAVFLLDSISQVLLHVLQGVGRFDLAAVLSSSASLANSLMALTVLMRGYQILSLMVVDLITASFLAIMGLAAIWKYARHAALSLRMRIQEIAVLLREASSQFLLAFSGRVLWELDTLLVPRFFSVSGVTPYWIGRRLPYTWMNLMWAGGLPAAQEGADSSPATLRKLFKIYLLQVSLAIPAAALFWNYSEQIIRVWMGGSFDPAPLILRILALAAAIDFLPSVFVFHFLACGKVLRLIRITLIAALVKIVFSVAALMAGNLVWLIYCTAAGAVIFTLLSYVLIWKETEISVLRLMAPLIPALLASMVNIFVFQFVPSPESAGTLAAFAFFFISTGYMMTYAFIRLFRMRANFI